MQFCASEACIPLLFLRNAEGEPCGPPEFPDAAKTAGGLINLRLAFNTAWTCGMEMTTTKGCRCTYKEHELDAVLHGAVLLIEWIFWLWLGSKPPTDSAFETCFPRRGGNGASVGYREWSCGFISIARIKHLQSGRCRIHRWENYQIGRKANFVTGTGNSRGPTLDRRIPDRSSRVRQHLRPGRVRYLNIVKIRSMRYQKGRE